MKIKSRLRNKFIPVNIPKIFNQEKNASKVISKLIDKSKSNDIRIMDNKLIIGNHLKIVKRFYNIIICIIFS